jgi:hypothetical protein
MQPGSRALAPILEQDRHEDLQEAHHADRIDVRRVLRRSPNAPANHRKRRSWLVRQYRRKNTAARTLIAANAPSIEAM